MFRRFHRLETAAGVPGSGLGLAMVRATAVAHGGTATTGEREGGGNVFRFRLRTVPDQRREPAGPTRCGSGHRRRHARTDEGDDGCGK